MINIAVAIKVSIVVNERKVKLLNYLYPNESVRSFCCNDLYQELIEILPTKICISTNNLKPSIRKQNLHVAKGIVYNFLSGNQSYKDKVIELYAENDITKIVECVLLGYVFFLYCSHAKYARADIFRDKKSIFYSPISILDIL